jgi:hypothetical protein
MVPPALPSLSPLRRLLNPAHMNDSCSKFQLVIHGVTFVTHSTAWVQVHAPHNWFRVGSTLVFSTAKSIVSAVVEEVSQTSDVIVQGVLTQSSKVLLSYKNCVEAAELSTARELSTPTDFRHDPYWAECQRISTLAYQVEKNQKKNWSASANNSFAIWRCFAFAETLGSSRN